jgi:metal-responsive CopG/Arc/MetJ family transcriptional regulator
MKTAVSIPDDVYDRIERLARRTKRSRSRLFQDALGEYLARHDRDEVTDAMNATVEELGIPGDAFVSTAASSILERNAW